MPNALTGTVEVSNLVLTAYSRLVDFALRSQPQFRQFVDTRPAQVTTPGETIMFPFWGADLAPATAPLDQYTDVDAVAPPNTTGVPVVLNEHGNASIITRRLQLTSFVDIDPPMAYTIGNNMADSMDTLIQNAVSGKFTTIAPTGDAGAVTVLPANSGLFYGTGFDAATATGGANTVETTDLMSSRVVRWAVTKLRARNVVPTKGQYYTCLIHPEVSVDLREESGPTGWRVVAPEDAQRIWVGEVGAYEGAVFVEDSRMLNGRVGAGAAGSEARVYNTYFFGKQAIAEAVKEEPHIVFGQKTDKLMRFTPVGWYGFLGWAPYRREAAIQVLTSSSMRPGA